MDRLLVTPASAASSESVSLGRESFLAVAQVGLHMPLSDQDWEPLSPRGHVQCAAESSLLSPDRRRA